MQYRSIYLVFLVVTLLNTGCVSLNSSTAKTMSTQGLCDLVNPKKYITTFEEREAAYKELEKRKADCNVKHIKIH